jgi:hypothetical protein
LIPSHATAFPSRRTAGKDARRGGSEVKGWRRFATAPFVYNLRRPRRGPAVAEVSSPDSVCRPGDVKDETSCVPRELGPFVEALAELLLADMEKPDRP